MIILAIDTADRLCAASVHDTRHGERGRSVLDLGKGHAEHLIGVIDEAMERAGVTYADLDAIAVAVGPGSFTGIRVGVATARGLALALSRPAVGIGTLEAMAAQAQAERPGSLVVAARQAGRGQIHMLAVDSDGALRHPATAVAMAGDLPFDLPPASLLVGSAASVVKEKAASPALIHAESDLVDIATYARLAAQRLAAGGSMARPVPLYLRDADAKPQAGFTLARRSEPS